MDTKFTPAPWVAHGSDVGIILDSDEQSSGMMHPVAYIDMYNFGDDVGEDNEIGKANAHLIAAAPEMYEMLESCLSEMYQLINEVNDQRAFNITSSTENEPDYHDHETLHLIDRLLAKARGETSKAISHTADNVITEHWKTKK